jgi:hypothetical protein
MKFRARENLCQHNLHLIGCEGCAETVPNAATEGEKLVRGGLFAEEPIGIELFRFRPKVRATMGQINARGRNYTGRQLTITNTGRRLQPTTNERHDGIQP